MNELVKHIEAINAKSKEWMDANPGSWAGMITTDPEHWKEYGITTPAQYDRYMLEMDVYEMHKSAYGVKGRHYDFDNMTDQELKDELEHLCKVANEEYEREQKFYAEQVEVFKALVQKTIDLGAGDEETALRWLTAGEKFYHSQCVESWVYDHNILFTQYGKEIVKKLENLVTYVEAA
ncbi:MAG: hypothetical protein VW235_12890 [Rhodospirillaceae bacterium]|jgi:hypothetical protein